MPFGRIINFNFEKGFGFIVLEDGSELFFHIRGGRKLKEDPRAAEGFAFIESQRLTEHPYRREPKGAGEEVAYRIGPGPKGSQAAFWGFADELKNHTPIKRFITRAKKRLPDTTRSESWGGHGKGRER